MCLVFFLSLLQANPRSQQCAAQDSAEQLEAWDVAHNMPHCCPATRQWAQQTRTSPLVTFARLLDEPIRSKRFPI